MGSRVSFIGGFPTVHEQFRISRPTLALLAVAASSLTTEQQDDADIRRILLGEKELRIRQHFFEKPVQQPKGLPNRHADLTGLKLWPTSMPFLSRLKDDLLPSLRQRLESDSRPLRVLELGSGCGLLGIGVAALGEQVVLTDPALDVNFSEELSGNTLQRLTDNIGLNKELVGDRASAQKLVWGDSDDMEAVADLGPFDLVLASDVLYNTDSYSALMATMQQFSKEGAPILIGYWPRQPGEARFFKEAEKYFQVHTEPMGGENKAILARLSPEI